MAATMSDGYRDAIANEGGALITHIGLVIVNNDEITGGSYARIAVTWTTAPADGVGTIRPTADLTFEIPAGITVAGWRGFNAAAPNGDINYGGADLTNEVFVGAGQYKLLKAATGIKHDNPA
ncbi:MAG TPA: hypothetical protein VMV86_03420 [Methanosarcinales archaeon]|nr:hypothetical protein [Methanosarcinales archaeon]